MSLHERELMRKPLALSVPLLGVVLDAHAQSMVWLAAIADRTRLPGLGRWTHLGFATLIGRSVFVIPPLKLLALASKAQVLWHAIIDVLKECLCRARGQAHAIVCRCHLDELVSWLVGNAPCVQGVRDGVVRKDAGQLFRKCKRGCTESYPSILQRAVHRARGIDGEAAITVEVAADEVPLHLYRHGGKPEREALPWPYPDSKKVAHHKGAGQLEYVAARVWSLPKWPIIANEFGGLLKAVKVIHGDFHAMLMARNTPIAGNEAKHPRAFWHPGLEEVLVKVMGAATSGYHAQFRRLLSGPGTKASVERMAAKFATPAAKVCRYFSKAVAQLPIAAVELFRRDRIVRMQDCVHGPIILDMGGCVKLGVV